MTTRALTVIAAIVAASSLAFAADETADKLNRLEERFSESLVQVRYRQQVSRSTAEPPAEGELTTTGVIVSAPGIVMVSAIVYEPFNEVPHGVGIRFPASVSRAEAQIADARIRLMDGSEYAATHLGRDPDARSRSFKSRRKTASSRRWCSKPIRRRRWARKSSW